MQNSKKGKFKKCRKNLGIASAGAAGLKELTQSLESSFFRQGMCLKLSSFFRQGMCFRCIYVYIENVLFRARSVPLEKEGVRWKKWMNKKEMKWYTIASWLAGNSASPERWGERETLSNIWMSNHRQCFHLCAAEGVGSNSPRTSREWTAPDPPLWLTWEWQDYATLQDNPFSNQLTQHHIWWEMRFGLDFARTKGLEDTPLCIFENLMRLWTCKLCTRIVCADDVITPSDSVHL